jgi:hypothetical protein
MEYKGNDAGNTRSPIDIDLNWDTLVQEWGGTKIAGTVSRLEYNLTQRWMSVKEMIAEMLAEWNRGFIAESSMEVRNSLPYKEFGSLQKEETELHYANVLFSFIYFLFKALNKSGYNAIGAKLGRYTHSIEEINTCSESQVKDRVKDCLQLLYREKITMRQDHSLYIYFVCKVHDTSGRRVSLTTISKDVSALLYVLNCLSLQDINERGLEQSLVPIYKDYSLGIIMDLKKVIAQYAEEEVEPSPYVWDYDSKGYVNTRLIHFNGKRLSLEMIGQMFTNAMREVLTLLTSTVTGMDLFEFETRLVLDDFKRKDVGYCFLMDERNTGLQKSISMLPDWIQSQIARYGGFEFFKTQFSKNFKRIQEILLLLLYVASGMPPRATELTHLLVFNSVQTSRNLYLLPNNEFVLIPMYSKTSNMVKSAQRVICRFPHPDVGNCLLVYLTYLRIVYAMIHEVSPTPFLYEVGHCPLSSTQIGRFLNRMLGEFLGQPIVHGEFRKCVCIMAQEHFKNVNVSNRGYTDEYFAYQAGHTPETDARYIIITRYYSDIQGTPHSITPTILARYRIVSSLWNRCISQPLVDQDNQSSVVEEEVELLQMPEKGKTKTYPSPNHSGCTTDA